jgi:pyruvate ferredoxin oxidoreductase delta subunit
LQFITLLKGEGILESSVRFQKKMIECSLLEQNKGKPFRSEDRPEWTPEWDRDKCIRCGLCYVYCPDGAVYRTDDGFFDVDGDKCKGCGICHRECWFGAISMVEEE